MLFGPLHSNSCTLKMEFTSKKVVPCFPDMVQKDNKGMWIFGEAESKRRVVMIEKKDGSYGFTLQSYGVRYKHGNRETDFITYVNAVEKDGAAFHSGLREGDVILSINGQNMARVEHKSLVNFIRQCPTHLKMVVVSDERARKVELHMRYVHLQKKLHDKMKELEQLNWKEKEILSGAYRNPCGSPLGAPCLSGSSSGCCFCPQKSSGKYGQGKDHLLDEKEKSKTISTMTGVELEKDLLLFYESYRKSQSSRELTLTGSQNGGSVLQGGGNVTASDSNRKPSRKSSGSNPTTSPSNTAANRNAATAPANSNSSSNTLEAPMSATARLRSTSPLIKSIVINPQEAGGTSGRSSSASGSGSGAMASSSFNSSGTNTLPNLGSSSLRNSSAPAGSGDAASQSKPKSWDNLMATKSFGGYGFGFGYGYFPSKPHGHGNHPNHHHVTHPHHHNHHSHCNHSHSSYYYSSTNPGTGKGANSSAYSSSSGGGREGHLVKGSYAEYRHCHVTPFSNSGAYQVVTTGKTIRPGSCESGNPGSSRTLPSASRSSNATPNFGTTATATSKGKTKQDSFQNMAKLEKTLSDSSLNSEQHKDFPKNMTYFSPSSSENVRFESDDDYDQYRNEDATTSKPKKHNIFV